MIKYENITEITNIMNDTYDSMLYDNL